MPKKTKFKSSIALCLTLCLIYSNMFMPINALHIVEAATDDSDKYVVAKVDNFTFETEVQIDSTTLNGIDSPYSDVAKIHEFWGSDGNYHIVYTNDDMIFISLVSKQMKLLQTLEIKKDLPKFGSIIQDKNGYYYIVYGEDDTAYSPDNSTKTVLSIVKYDSNGKQLDKTTYTGLQTSFTYSDNGTKEPFSFGNCDLAIDSSGVLVCVYGRIMYNGHQSTHALYVDTNSMTKLDYIPPYTSHAFDQRILITSDGGYLSANRGDAAERGISLSKIYSYTYDRYSYPAFVTFHLRTGNPYQTTYATIADISEASNGYVLVGASEKTLAYATAKEIEFNESRNVFMQVINKDFTRESTNDPYTQMLIGESRIPVDTYKNMNWGLQEGARDYGVLWLTNYTGTEYASNVKMVDIGDDKILVMWEKKDYTHKKDYWNDTTQYIESYYMVVKSDGSISIPVTLIQDEKLTQYGKPDYKDGCIYWETSDGESKTFVIHRLTIGKTMLPHITSINIQEDTMLLGVGEKKKIQLTIAPSNTDETPIYEVVKSLPYHTDETVMVYIDKDGYVTMNGYGLAQIKISSPHNKKINQILTVETTDTAPTSVKVKKQADMFELTWKNTKYGKHYEVFFSSSKKEGYEYIGTPYQNSFTLDNWAELEYDKAYYFKVRSENIGELSNNPFSEPIVFYIQSAPEKLNLTKKSKTSVTMEWTKSGNANGYEIWHYNADTKKYELIKTVTGNKIFKYTHTGLKPGKNHSFKIRAYKEIDGKKFYSTFCPTAKIDYRNTELI